MEQLQKIERYFPFMEHLSDEEAERLKKNVLSKTFSKG